MQISIKRQENISDSLTENGIVNLKKKRNMRKLISCTPAKDSVFICENSTPIIILKYSTQGTTKVLDVKS